MNRNVSLRLVCTLFFILAAAVLFLFAGLQLLDKSSCLFPVLTAVQYPDWCQEEQEDVSVLVHE